MTAQQMVNEWAEMGYIDMQAKQANGDYPNYVSVQLTEHANYPLMPTNFRQRELSLAGGVIGLVIGVLALNLPFFSLKKDIDC